MTADVWSKLTEYGILVLLLSIVVWAAYNRLWVSGKFHDKEVSDLKTDYESRITELKKDRDENEERLRTELNMWRGMVIDGLNTVRDSNQVAKVAIDLASKTRQ